MINGKVVDFGIVSRWFLEEKKNNSKEKKKAEPGDYSIAESYFQLVGCRVHCPSTSQPRTLTSQLHKQE